MNNDWTDILRDKLAEHEMTPPAGLWEEIEAKMEEPAVGTAVASHSRQLLRRGSFWISAAAACAMLLIGLSLFFKFGETGEQPSQPSGEEIIAEDSHEETPATVDSTKILPATESQKPLMAKAVKNKKEACVERAEEKELTAVAENNAKTEEKPIETKEEKTEEKKADTETPESKQKVELKSEPQVFNKLLEQEHYADNYRRQKPEKKRGGLSLNLYAANLPTPSLGGSDNIANSYMDSNFVSSFSNTTAIGIDSTKFVYSSFALSEETIEAKHHRPVRVGVSFAIPITEKLNLTSGLTFSYLKSDFTHIKNTVCYTEEQKLTYIGLPFGATYQLMEYWAISLYLSAGGMVEQCISGEEKRPQLSAFGGGGLQFDLGKHVSLFAEPRISYYLDNHSNVINTYKVDPMNFDLNFGLRINLNR